MKKDDLAKRVQDLQAAVAQSAENYQKFQTALQNAANAHNALVGRLDEANYLLQQADKGLCLVTDECTAA